MFETIFHRGCLAFADPWLVVGRSLVPLRRTRLDPTLFGGERPEPKASIEPKTKRLRDTGLGRSSRRSILVQALRSALPRPSRAPNHTLLNPGVLALMLHNRVAEAPCPGFAAKGTAPNLRSKHLLAFPFFHEVDGRLG